MLPAVAKEALELAKDPDCTSRQFASVVERDAKLAADILSIANSAVFSGGRPIANLPQAIVRLGFSHCRNLILTSSAASLMKSMPLEREWVREVLYQHSFVTATTCVHLNRTLNLGFQGEEFTAGLLHDFGRMLLAVADPELFAAADMLDFIENRDSLERERSVFGTDHCYFGAWFAEDNGLPETVVSAIAYHHQPELDQPEQKLTALVATADHMANHLQVYESADKYDPTSNIGIYELSKITSGYQVESFCEIAHTLMEEVLADLQDTSPSSAGA